MPGEKATKDNSVTAGVSAINAAIWRQLLPLVLRSKCQWSV